MRIPDAGLSGRVATHLRHNVVGYIALFCFAVGGIAQALPGRNTVDSGDIQARQVKASDLAAQAVRASRIAPGAVGSQAVGPDALNGGDIAESTLELPSDSIGPDEEANGERRIVFTAGEIDPAYGSPAPARVTLGSTTPALSFDPAQDESVLLTLEVPRDRVPGTPMLIEVLWSPADGGLIDQRVRWDGTMVTADDGESVSPGITIGLNGAVSFGQNDDALVRSTLTGGSLGSVTNGDLVFLRIFRDADHSDDTIPADAQLHAIVVRYTASD